MNNISEFKTDENISNVWSLLWLLDPVGSSQMSQGEERTVDSTAISPTGSPKDLITPRDEKN